MGTLNKIDLSRLESQNIKMKVSFELFNLLRKKLKHEDMEILRKIERYSNELLKIKNLNK